MILFAVRFLRKGLIRWMGPGLDSKLEGWMGKPLGAAFSGFAFGAFAPSSTTQSILAVNLLKNKKISSANILSFLLWANAGITLTVQLMSLRISAYYPLFLFAGVLAFQFLKGNRAKAVGQCLTAFGLIFLAMTLMGSAASTAMNSGDLSAIVKIVSRHTLVMLAFSAACTVVLQSSTAVMGIAFALAPSGLIPPEGMLAGVLGTNLGIGLTTILAGWRDEKSRILALAGMLVKSFVVAAAVYFLPEISQFLAGLSLSPSSSGAVLHAAVSIAGAALGTIASPVLAPWFRRAERLAALDAPSSSPHLDYSLVSTPPLALACASREAVRMGAAVSEMYAAVWEAFDSPSEQVARRALANLGPIGQMEEEISSYVGSLGWSEMSAESRGLAFGVVNFASQLEGIADIIARDLVPLAACRSDKSLAMDAESADDLRRIREMVGRRLDASTAILASRDPTLAAAFLQSGEEVKRFTIGVLKSNYRKMGMGHDHAASTLYLDVIRSLRRISGQLNTIGHTFAPSSLHQAESRDES